MARPVKVIDEGETRRVRVRAIRRREGQDFGWGTGGSAEFGVTELRMADWGLPISDRNSLQKRANKSACQASILVESSGAQHHGPGLSGGGAVRNS